MPILLQIMQWFEHIWLYLIEGEDGDEGDEDEDEEDSNSGGVTVDEEESESEDKDQQIQSTRKRRRPQKDGWWSPQARKRCKISKHQVSPASHLYNVSILELS